jgi:tetratricopeptide (TPR) repeat protein
LASSYELAGNVDEAERLLRAATSLDPQDWFNWSWLGGFLLQHRGGLEARPVLERAARLAPADVWQPRAYLGTAALQQAQYDEAIDLLESLPASATDAANENNLAIAYYYSNRPDRWQRAEEHFRAAIELNPGRAEYHGNLADLHAVLGRKEEAVVTYRRALELSRAENEANPGDREARLHVALYAAKADECPAALAQAGEAWRARPSSSAELHEIALIFAVCRERDEAIAALAAAVERGYSSEVLGSERELEWLRDDPRFPRPGTAPGARPQ